MNEREKLAGQISAYVGTIADTPDDFLSIADLILEDRKRIVQPIIRFKGTNNYIDETLTLAGIE